MTEIALRLSEIARNISQVAIASGRNSDSVKLVAVSKTYPVTAIKDAFSAGQRLFGENRPQEMKEKYEELKALGGYESIEWHVIGQLQKNKVKYIAPFVELIHSVDSLDLLKTINKEAFKNNRLINVLLQISDGRLVFIPANRVTEFTQNI